MKKIFRMALVFALAGATLLYTGCTKDYNEDINNLAGQINDLKSTHATDIANLNSALNNLESSLKSADAAIEAAYKKADDALAQSLKDAEGKIAANEDAINGLKGDVKDLQDAVDANADDIKALNDDITKVAEDVAKDLAALETKLTGAFQAADADLQKQIDDNLADAKNSLDEAKKLLLNELRSIVAVPQAYVEGVEATEYGFATLNLKDFTKAPKGGEKVYESTASNWLERIWESWMLSMAEPEFTYATFPEGAEYAVTPKVDKDKKPVVKTVGQLATAYYDLNPSSFDTKKAEWALYPNAVPFIKVKADAKAWKPVFDTIEPVEKSNDFAVKYYVENPELLAADFAAQKLPTMELVASLDENRDITSNDLVLYAYNEEFKALAFDSAKKDYTTVNQCSLGYELYTSAVPAVYFKASLACDYRKSIDLAELVNVHMNKDGKEYEATLAKLQEVYPELDMTFELVDYTVGENKTSQSAYAKISGSVFQPKTVSGEVSESTTSPVGKKPLVLVKLTNGKDVVLAGYFKVAIVKNADVEVIDFPAFKDVIPFMCQGAEFATTYDQFSELIIDQLSLPYKNFKAIYSVANTNGNYSAIANSSAIKCQVFVKNDKGEMVKTADYGEITYNVDATNAVNDSFAWALDFAAIKKIGAGKSATVYVELFDGEYSKVYVSFSASVAPIAHYDFGANKVENRWFDEIDGEAYNTIKLNVPVNAATGADIADFSKNLDDLFGDQKPALILKEDSDAVYFNEKGEPVITASVVYEFAAKQPVVNGYQLVYGPDTKIAGATKDELYVAYLATADAKANSYAKVAEINGSVIKYAETAKAKELLNAYSHKATSQDEMLYANIQANISYGADAQDQCVACDTAIFHARFLRPLTIEWNDQTINEESQTDGANVNVVAFLKSIVDWNNQNVIDVDLTKKTWADHKEKTLNMFSYYEFKNLTIDLANATRDHAVIGDTNKAVKISTVGDVITLGTVNKDGLFTEVPAYATGVINFNDPCSLDDLKNVVINYKNADANVKEFNVFIPASIEYYWGTFKTTLKVTIKDTPSTQPL